MKLNTVVFASLVAAVSGHGSLSFPMPRNQFNTHYCPHCANGRGVCGGVGGQWPAPVDSDYWVGSYTSPRTYLTAGGTVDVEYYLTAAHLGHFVVELCYWDGKATKIDDSCFQRLERDGTDQGYSPYNPRKPTIAYLPNNSCATGKTMKLRFKVPAGRTADRAILRWYWQTGNSCLNDDSVKGGQVDSSLSSWKLGSCGVATSNGGSCGSNCPSASCSGEQFKNCADVIVSATGPSNVNSGNYQTEDGSVTTPTTRPTKPTTTSTTIRPTERPTQPAPIATTTPERYPQPSESSSTEPPCHKDPVKHCKMSVKGVGSWYDEICKYFCSEFAETQERWCTLNGYGQDAEGLVSCVLYAYGAACKRA